MSQDELDAQFRRAAEVQEKYADLLMRLPHVIGVGVGYARRDGEAQPQVALVVMVDEKMPLAALAPDMIIPAELDGVRVDVQPLGSFMAQDDDSDEPDAE